MKTVFGLLSLVSTAGAGGLDSLRFTLGGQTDLFARSPIVLWYGGAVCAGWDPWRLRYAYQLGEFGDQLESDPVFLDRERPTLRKERHILTAHWQHWRKWFRFDLGAGWGWTRKDRVVAVDDPREVFYEYGPQGRLDTDYANLHWYRLREEHWSDPVARVGLGVGWPRVWTVEFHLEQCAHLAYGLGLEFHLR
ncbi:MAG TPA: hypothetical protein PKO15_08780 [Fibrobacteria bacterium]|nr:hypothetical protein [Fibrobacteria bacterium]